MSPWGRKYFPYMDVWAGNLGLVPDMQDYQNPNFISWWNTIVIVSALGMPA